MNFEGENFELLSTTAWALVWNATFTLICLFIIALILDEAGFFKWLALLLAHTGIGRTRLLFPLVILVGALLTPLLTNEGTASIWAIAVLELLLALDFSAKGIVAFVFATGFIANTTSLLLPASTWVNLVAVDYFDIDVLRYVLVMAPVNLAAIAISLAVLWFYFDRDIPLTYNLAALPSPEQVIVDPLVCRWSFAILGLLPIAYFFADYLDIPICCVAALAALVMLTLAGRWFQKNAIAPIAIGKVLRKTPWQVILFSLGVSLLVVGLHDANLTVWLSQGGKWLSGWGLTQVAIATGFWAALLSGVTNSLPAVLINTLAIQDTTAIEPAVREVMVYANIIGGNIGANLTPIGSLSTLAWINVLTRKGCGVSWVQYVQMAFILTIPVLFISLLSLAIWLPWLIA